MCTSGLWKHYIKPLQTVCPHSMAAMTASSSNLHALGNSSQPTSKASSPASPTASFQNQQPSLPRSFINLKPSVRGQNSSFPSTPTSERSNNAPNEPPPGMAYAEFVRMWSDSHVARWLSDIKCGSHASTFKMNDIRGDVLLELDQVTLKEMGIASIGDRFRIVNAVKILRQKCSTRSTLPLFEAVRPRVYINGEYGDGNSSTSYGSSTHGRSDSMTDTSPSTRFARRLENGRPPPLHLNSNTRTGDLPRLIRDGQDSAKSSASLRPLPQPSLSPSSLSTTTPSSAATSSTRPNLPPLPPAPRTQPPLPPGGRSVPGRLQPSGNQSQRSRTPTQADPPSYVNLPLPPAPSGQSMLTPTSSQGSNWSGSGPGYGLPSDPRPGNLGGKRTPVRATNPNAAHHRNMSFSGINSPLATTPTTKARPSTGNNSSHPYASDTARSQALQAPTPQQLQAIALSPIAESFVSGAGASSPPTPFAVGRGTFTRPMTPSHAAAPSLDDLRRKLVRFLLPDEGHSCTINAEDCSGGIEVLEKVLKKFNKLRFAR
jgi:mitogen-activated protein kinase kinase kinase